MEDLSQDPFPAAVAYLEPAGKPPRQFHHTVIKNRNTRFETHRHACAIHLGQQIVWQVRSLVRQHHPLHQAQRIVGPENRLGVPVVRTADHQALGILPR